MRQPHRRKIQAQVCLDLQKLAIYWRVAEGRIRTALAVSQASDERTHCFGGSVESQKQQGSGTVNRQPKPHMYKTQSTDKCCGTPPGMRTPERVIAESNHPLQRGRASDTFRCLLYEKSGTVLHGTRQTGSLRAPQNKPTRPRGNNRWPPQHR